MTEAEMTDRLRTTLDSHRFRHTMGVAETAKALAAHYGSDVEKAYIAGLLHDCAKNIPYAEAIEGCRKSGVILKEICIKEPSLIHAFYGEIIAKQVYGIEDEEILHAIRYHTTGHSNMSLFTKIIFLADSIEPGRTNAGVDTVRKLAYTDLDEALLRTMDATIRHIINKGGLLDNDTIDARNYLLFKMKSQI